MRDCTRWSLRCQVEWLCKQYAQYGDLPFSNVLSKKLVLETLGSVGGRYYDSLYNPVVTLWIFLTQMISADRSMAAAVEGFLGWRLSQGLSACSTNTGGYSRARGRLGEPLLAKLTRITGSELVRQAIPEWLWKGRHVKLFDGSTVSMPDTPANQAAYPQQANQKPGVGFPLARIGVLFSLSVGSVLDLGLRRWAGKFQSELAILRDMWDSFDVGDVLVTDRYLCSHMEIAVLGSLGVDVVARMHAQRKVDFRRGKQIGIEDHLVSWKKPPKPEWMSNEQYAALPDEMLMRELRYLVQADGFRPTTIVLATTLLDAEQYPWDDVANLYGQRWDAEINLRSLKTIMQMDVLRGETPEMVRKEIWACLLAYNQIRTVIAQAASQHGKPPCNISFKRALRTVESFRPTLAAATPPTLPKIYEELFHAIASHQIGDRPGREEPRCVKRRPKPYPRLTQPRNEARTACRKKG